MEPLAHVECVRCVGNELRPEPVKERQHLFPRRIDEGHIGYIDEQGHSIKAPRCEHANVLGVVTGESAFKLESHSVHRILYVDAKHRTSTVYPGSQQRRLERFILYLVHVLCQELAGVNY